LKSSGAVVLCITESLPAVSNVYTYPFIQFELHKGDKGKEGLRRDKKKAVAAFTLRQPFSCLYIQYNVVSISQRKYVDQTDYLILFSASRLLPFQDKGGTGRDIEFQPFFTCRILWCRLGNMDDAFVDQIEAAIERFIGI
jgi:hypothetical protein